MTSTEPRNKPILSVIIPAYNEAHRLGPYLEAIAVYLGSRSLSYEILVVDDGSRDGTSQLVEQAAQNAPAVRVIRLSQNRGKGAAVRAGMQEARGDLLLFADADGATPIQELERLEAAIQDGADLAIGSRPLADRDDRYRVVARWHRSVLGNLFNRLVQRLGIPGIADTQCGFKLFRRTTAHALFSIACIDGYGFDLELLYLAQRRGDRIVEVPINWTDQPGSKVRVFRDGLGMLRELLQVRRNDANGVYRSSSIIPGLDPTVSQK